MPLHPLLPIDVIRRKRRPFPRPLPIQPPPEIVPLPFFDAQEAEYISEGIVYDGRTGKPIRNLITGEEYI